MSPGNPRRPATLTGEQVYARTYDSFPLDWPGELAGYLRHARHAAIRGRPRVLDVACGTGRVTIPLAEAGCDVHGVDLSADMIEVARSNTSGGNPRWTVGDMRSFTIDERFDMAFVPAHSFQFMCTAADQVAALTAIARHLEPYGRLVVHLDRPSQAWMAGLPGSPPPPADRRVGVARVDPATGHEWHMRSAWTFDAATEVAKLHLDWIRLDADGAVVEVVGHDPMENKVIGRVEMEHALARAGYDVIACHGDFEEAEVPSSGEGQMVWVATPTRGR